MVKSKVKHAIKDRYVFFTIISLLVIVLDQVIKYFIKQTPLGSKHIIIDGVFSLTHVHNFGASFGILQHQTTILIWFSIFVIAGIFFYLHEIPTRYFPYVALILGGTVANLIDRISYTFVIDFISIYKWPDFNIADIAISVGALALVWLIAKEK